MISVSVIIPVYNAGKSLRRCIRSVLAQTVENFELLLVNDGSTDNSAAICDEYAAQDARVRVIHQSNAGVSSARNAGLDASEGEWVVFIDADDHVEKLYLESLLSQTRSSGVSALVMQGFRKIYPDGLEEQMDLGNSVARGASMRRLFSEQPIFEFGYPFGKLYNRVILEKHHLRFDTHLKYAEDMIFMLQYIQYVDSVIFIPGTHYHYQVNASSLSQRYNSHESEFRCFKRFMELNESISNHFGFSVTPESLRYAALQLMRSIYALYISKGKSTSSRIKIIKKLKIQYIEFIRNNYIPSIPLFKIIKKSFLSNLFLFDLLCRIKFQ